MNKGQTNCLLGYPADARLTRSLQVIWQYDRSTNQLAKILRILVDPNGIISQADRLIKDEAIQIEREGYQDFLGIHCAF